MKQTGIVFPILNNLTPTVDGCSMKVLEEVGELMQLIGKGQGKSGESHDIADLVWAVRSVEESLDTAQSAITLAHTLCRDYKISMDDLMEKHERKLKEKGYLKYDNGWDREKEESVVNQSTPNPHCTCLLYTSPSPRDS